MKSLIESYPDIFCIELDNNQNTLDSFSSIVSKFNYPNAEKYHPGRKIEFLLGRVALNLGIKKIFNRDEFNFPIGEKREPILPKDVVASISHSKNTVIALVAKKIDYDGIGIDIEEFGRMKPELQRHIRTDQDIKSHPEFTDEQLLTFLFSAKESLYKTIYPHVNIFFGFEAAAITDICFDKKTFTIELLKDLNENFCLDKRSKFQGHFEINKNQLISYIILKK